MSEANIALIEAHLTALTQVGIDVWLKYGADDVEIGRDGFVGFMGRWTEDFEE